MTSDFVLFMDGMRYRLVFSCDGAGRKFVTVCAGNWKYSYNRVN